jgi:small-conductance mechanosensitive channel
MTIAQATWSVVRVYAIPVGIILIATAIGTILHFALHERFKRTRFLSSHVWLSIAYDSLGSGVILWFAAVGAEIAVAGSDLTPSVRRALNDAIFVLFIGSITVVCARFAGAAVLRLSRGPGQRLASGTLFASVAQWIVGIMGFMIILDSLGLHITPLLTALGVGGLAVALALQPPLANLFSGLQLLAAHEVRPGDYIALPTGQEGFIVDINWRSTSIRESSNNIVVVPNQSLAQATFVSYRLPEPQIATRVPLKVAYGSDLEFVEYLAVQAAERARDDLQSGETSKDVSVRFDELADTAVSLSVTFFVSRVVDQDRARSTFLRRFYEALQRHGLGSPTQNPVVAERENAGKE